MKTLARAAHKAGILRRLRDVSPESPRRWGTMTAHQMVCHLGDSLRMAIGQKPASDMGGLAARTLIKWTVLYVPIRWPAGILTSPEIDQAFGGTKPGGFEADVAQVEQLVERITIPSEPFVWPDHPYFGPMSGAAWLRWGYLHTDHHLRQFGA